MSDLIARIAAGEGDNAEVLTALGWRISSLTGHGEPPGKRPRKIIPSNLLPAPLNSVDDALRLVPEGWRTYAVSQAPDNLSDWVWRLTTAHNVAATMDARSFAKGHAPTAARALTIAILRTKETTDV